MYLDPEVIAGSWTSEEDAVLQRKHDELGSRWAAIAMFLPGRTEVQIKNRYVKLHRDVRIAWAGRPNAAISGNPGQFPPILPLYPDWLFWARLDPLTYRGAAWLRGEFRSMGLTTF
jgi:hypothetical protein